MTVTGTLRESPLVMCRSQVIQLIYWFELPHFRISFPNPGVTLGIQQTKEEGTLMKILTSELLTCTALSVVFVVG